MTCSDFVYEYVVDDTDRTFAEADVFCQSLEMEIPFFYLDAVTLCMHNAFDTINYWIALQGDNYMWKNYYGGVGSAQGFNDPNVRIIYPENWDSTYPKANTYGNIIYDPYAHAFVVENGTPHEDPQFINNWLKLQHGKLDVTKTTICVKHGMSSLV